MQLEAFSSSISRIAANLFVILLFCLTACSLIRDYSIKNDPNRKNEIDLPLCSCFPDYQPGDGSPADEVIDLDPTVDNYNEGGVILRTQKGAHTILVYYTTENQFFDYLKNLSPGYCLASSIRIGCMSGRVVVTEEVAGETVNRLSGGPPCEFPTEEVSPVSTPIINYIHCTARPRDPDETPYVPTATPTFTP
jgi:hypothetical protein